nr:hypothetical protein [uncultured Actinoplanes sp.]
MISEKRAPGRWRTSASTAGAQAAGFGTGAWDVLRLVTIEVVVATMVPAVGTILASP